MCISLEASAPRWLALLAALSLVACRAPIEEPKVTGPAVPSLFLELRSVTGEPVSEASVQLASGQSARSDASGQLLLEKLQPGLQLMHVRAPAFAPSLATFTLEENIQAGASLKLLPLGEPIPFNASKGIKTTSGGVSLDVPENALFDEAGGLIQGQVEVILAALDLEGGELLAAPGMMEGITRPGVEPVGLESLGVVVVIFQQDGHVIPFARRIGVRGQVPGSVTVGSESVRGQVPGSVTVGSEKRLPETVPAWRLEQDSGQWSPTGDMGRIVEAEEKPGTYEWEVTVDNPSPVFNVALPYWWRSKLADAGNPLQPPDPPWVETACLEVRVEDENGQPVAGRAVVARGVEYMGMSRGVTDENGQVLLEVMRARRVEVDAGGEPAKVVSENAGTCSGQGAPPRQETLQVPVRMCTPGAERDCAHGGPKGTLDRGVCRASRQYCDALGTQWSETCQGEVTPQRERCDNALDDDCDGEVNESCAPVCLEGEERRCYEGPEGSDGVGLCAGGVQKCVARGTAWGACEGQVLPREEDCSKPGDEDCDGVACQCWPGQEEKCEYGGPAGTEGVGACRASMRTCNDSGTEWEACTGEVTPLPEELCTTPGDDDCDGVENEGTVCVCVPHSSQGCYSGPEGTQGVGQCHAGTQQCNASGTGWGACTGEVTPQVESCANATDDDCNGHINDAPACLCLPGATGSCYTGPTGTQDVGLCHAGIRMCAASGTEWEACTGEVKPLPEELCTTPGDDDCDGVENETSVCVCVPGASESCYGGPTGTQGVGVCSAGTRTCNASGTAWGTCTGDVTPVAELCFNTQDDDCDGQIDENPPCAWSRASSMSFARARHTATLLGNGKVLVSGGTSTSNIVLQEAELYDPGTNTWSAAGSMASSRDRHTATLLGNGKVLVAGGVDENILSLKSAELYDPVSNTWSSVGSMTAYREGHTATLLGNGKVLIAGGLSIYAELYDPGTNTWSSAGTMDSLRHKATATLLGNGKVLVSGGEGAGNTFHQTAELYDPVSNTWSPAGSMTSPRERHTATLLGNGKVLVSGG
ncbi:Kelch repeat-containing protein, partial [Archangium gephyra]